MRTTHGGHQAPQPISFVVARVLVHVGGALKVGFGFGA